MTSENTNPEIKACVALARMKLLDAETLGQLIDNRTAEALASTAEISMRREIETDLWDRASNAKQREYHFTSQTDNEHVDSAIDTLTRWNRLDKDSPERPYKFVICSPGGSVIHGMKLYNVLKGIATNRPVITVASGLCASMGTIIHQAGSLRVIEPGCSYLIHDVSGESFGSIGNMQDTMEYMNKLNTVLHTALAEKSRLSLAEVAELSKRRDSWHMADETLAMGFADVIDFSINAHVGMPIPQIEEQAPLKKTRARKALEVKS